MVCKPIIISQFGMFASLRQCCTVCFTEVCVAAFPLGHTSFCQSLACLAGAGGCPANPAVIMSNPGHSFPAAFIHKAETAWQLWKMMDNVACLGFLKARKSSCADLVCCSGYGSGSDIFFFLCRWTYG